MGATMMPEQANARSASHDGSRISFGVAMASVVGIFCLAMPISAYLVGGFIWVHQAQYPRVSGFVIANSPWLPVLIGLVACIALVVKERQLKVTSAARVNAVAIATTLLIGGFTLLIMILPMVQLLRAMGY